VVNQDEIEGRRFSAEDDELDEGEAGAVFLGLWAPVSVMCFSALCRCGEMRGVGGASCGSTTPLVVRAIFGRLWLSTRLCPWGASWAFSVVGVEEEEEEARLRFLSLVEVVGEEAGGIVFPHVAQCRLESELVFEDETAASRWSTRSRRS
jgi:hypothetical protein